MHPLPRACTQCMHPLPCACTQCMHPLPCACILSHVHASSPMCMHPMHASSPMCMHPMHSCGRALRVLQVLAHRPWAAARFHERRRERPRRAPGRRAMPSLVRRVKATRRAKATMHLTHARLWYGGARCMCICATAALWYGGVGHLEAHLEACASRQRPPLVLGAGP